MNISDRLIAVRKQFGLTQEEIAERMGVSRQAVSKWETGESMPDLVRMIQLADALGISLDTLCGRTTLSEEPEKRPETVPEAGEAKQKKALRGSGRPLIIALALTGSTILLYVFALLIRPNFPLSPTFLAGLNRILFQVLLPKMIVPAVCMILAVLVAARRLRPGPGSLLTMILLIGNACFHLANQAVSSGGDVVAALFIYGGELVLTIGAVWFAAMLVYGILEKRAFVWTVGIVGTVVPVLYPIAAEALLRDAQPAFVLSYVVTGTELLLFAALAVYDFLSGKKPHSGKEGFHETEHLAEEDQRLFQKETDGSET